MFQQFLIGGLMIVITTAVHAGCTMAVVAAFRAFFHHRLDDMSLSVKVAVLTATVLLFFLASLGEIALWAILYLWLGTISTIEAALYFSGVTFTTVGYGDVVLHSSFRLLAPLEAINGVIMFGWTTAVIVAIMHRILTHNRPTTEINHPNA